MSVHTEASVGTMMPITQPDQVFRKTESTEIDEAFGALNPSMFNRESSSREMDESETFSNIEKSADLMDSDSPEERRKLVLDPVDPNTEDPTEMDYDESEIFSNIEKSADLMDSDSPEERRHAVLDPVDPETDNPTDMSMDEGSVFDNSGRVDHMLDSDSPEERRKMVLHSADSNSMNEDFNDLFAKCGVIQDPEPIGHHVYYTFDEFNEDALFTEDAHIDKDIRPVIDMLNAKGYKTIASCSGHPSARRKNDVYDDGIMYDKLYSGARIVFDKNYDIGAAPEYWTRNVMEKGTKVGIYVKPPSVNYAKGMRDDQYKAWKQKYMESLRKWAEELPKEGEKKELIEEEVIDDVINDLLIDIM